MVTRCHCDSVTLGDFAGSNFRIGLAFNLATLLEGLIGKPNSHKNLVWQDAFALKTLKKILSLFIFSWYSLWKSEKVRSESLIKR